jgi:hypothetical protein
VKALLETATLELAQIVMLNLCAIQREQAHRTDE